ncbi:hypothetical protein B0H13DRAFT_1857114 [Mycena leptocephala]|nr:hypothetical protein B0H13DRAFT_1857114 [Mycena leptocephala]
MPLDLVLGEHITCAPAMTPGYSAQPPQTSKTLNGVWAPQRTNLCCSGLVKLDRRALFLSSNPAEIIQITSMDRPRILCLFAGSPGRSRLPFSDLLADSGDLSDPNAHLSASSYSFEVPYRMRHSANRAYIVLLRAALQAARRRLQHPGPASCQSSNTGPRHNAPSQCGWTLNRWIFSKFVFLLGISPSRTLPAYLIPLLYRVLADLGALRLWELQVRRLEDQ